MLELKRKLYRLDNGLSEQDLDNLRIEKGRRIVNRYARTSDPPTFSPPLSVLRTAVRVLPAVRPQYNDEITAALCMLPHVVTQPFGSLRLNGKQTEMMDVPQLFGLMVTQVFFYKPAVFTPKWGAYTFDDYGHLLAMHCTDVTDVLQQKKVLLVRPLTLAFMSKEILNANAIPAE